MINIQNSLIQYNKSDASQSHFFAEAKQGSFWDWRRTYVLKDENSNICFIQLNIFQRCFCNLAGCGIENYFKKIFSNRNIMFMEGKELDLLVYNTSNRTEEGRSQSEKVCQQIENESTQWRGNHEINLQTPFPALDNVHQRKEWWGIFANAVGSTGLDSLIAQTNCKAGVALDIGCGNSESAIYLLQRGWTVICLDYSQGALDVMKKRAERINQNWLKNNQLRLVCSTIEDYTWDTKVDLVLASSALPYFDPSKIRPVMANIYNCLKSSGFFIGNLFVAKFAGSSIDAQREMGAWFVPDIDDAGYLLAGQGYEVIEYDRAEQNPHSVRFIGKKAAVVAN